MIHEISVELQTRLKAQKCPIPVVDGPEPTTTSSLNRERIVIEHDLGGNDSFGPPRSQRVNPRHRATRGIACKATIYAQSAAVGAQVFEHRRRAEHILDLVYVGLEEVARARKNAWGPRGGRFVTPEALEGAERPGGAVYEFLFNFDRAIESRTWLGEAKPTATLTKKVMTGSPTLTFAEVGATGDTITRSAGSWIADGFVVGDVIRVTGSASNNVTGAIAALTATVMTLGTTDLANEGPVAGCSVTTRAIKSTTKVSFYYGPDDDSDPTNIPAVAETSCGG